MKTNTQSSPFFYRLMARFKPRIIKNIQNGIGPGQVILLLTTTGRKSGLPRVTPLRYEEIDGIYYVAAARGVHADWYRNLVANPRVEVQIQQQNFTGIAEPVCDPKRIADYFAVCLKRRPLFMNVVMRLDGLPLRYSRLDLERFAARKALVAIRPSL